MSIPKTKLRPPVLRVPIVQRARLTKTFADRRPLTVISAPAGSGKTTLTLDWLTHAKCKVAWLALDADDNDPIRFIRGLLAALEFVNMKIRIPSGQRDINAIITELINQFDDSEFIALVLDDYHLITTDTIHQALNYLIDHIPATLQLVLVTREEPPLSLARLRARRQLREFDIDDLRFTSEETKQFLHQVMGLNLSNEKIKILEHHTRGWIAGLQMAALSLQSNHDQEIPNADEHHFITEYLLDEVFNQQPQDVQTFLLNTSILDTFSPTLCKIIHPKNSQKILTRIEKSNLFITSSSGWYQYHPLFREFLLHQLQKDFPDRVQELHKRACHCLSENGLTAQAIPHAIAIKDFETAAGFVAALAPETFQRGELVTLRRWLDLLPDSAKWTHPRLCLIQIWLLLDSDLRAEAQIYLDQIGEFLEHNLRGEYLAVRALHAAMTHQPDLAFQYAQQAQATPEAKDPFMQTYVSFALGAAQKMSLNFFQAEQSFRTALSLADSAGNAYIALSALTNLSDVQYMQARLTEAEKTCNDAIKQFTDNSPDAHDWYWTLARAAFQKNKLDEALRLINHTIDLCMEWNNSPIQHARALLQRAIVQFALGDKSAAQVDLDAADTMSRSFEEILILRSIIRQRVLFAVDDGDVQNARQWLKTLAEYDEQPFPFYFAYTKGRVLLAEEKFKEANAIFRIAIKQLGELDFTLVRIEIMTWQAVALYKLGEYSQATQTLGEMIKLARQGNVVRPLVEACENLTSLIDESGNSLDRKDIAWVLDQVNRSSKHAEVKERSAVKGPGLTRREREILQLLAMGLSNQEMAERLFIAEGTLKRHIANLYQKLGVHNRTQAIQHLNQPV